MGPMSFTSFVPDILATVIGGAILTFLFFLIREKCFPLPRIEGTWKYVQKTKLTQYNPYIDMELEYIALLRTEGNKIFGTIEKIHGKESTGERDYVGPNRSRGRIEGFCEQRYFGQSRVILHVFEENEVRESSTLHILTIFKVDGDFQMIGNFSSTVANQTGDCKWRRVE